MCWTVSYMCESNDGELAKEARIAELPTRLARGTIMSRLMREGNRIVQRPRYMPFGVLIRHRHALWVGRSVRTNLFARPTREFMSFLAV